jgi:hypothetical protein
MTQIWESSDDPSSKDEPPEVDNTGDNRCVDNFYLFATQHLRRNPLGRSKLGFLAMLADTPCT